MSNWLIVGLLVVLVAIGYLITSRGSSTRKAEARSDAQAEARRYVERLGGQVGMLDHQGNDAAQQALTDAGERYTAAGGQLAQATTVQQFRLAQLTAYEGLYYVRAARTALGMDAGPELPPIPGQAQAGSVSERTSVPVGDRSVDASPTPSADTNYYYPGGVVAGQPVPRGWYSEPWWKQALVTGAWTAGSMLVLSSLFSGFGGLGPGAASSYTDGYAAGMGDATMHDGVGQGDVGFDGGFDGGDFGGFDGFGDF